jgi:acetyl esterase/lipase
LCVKFEGYSAVFFRAISAFFLLIIAFPALAQMTNEPPFAVTTERDIVYGTGLINKGDQIISRDLWLDAYLPHGAKFAPLPAVIFTHGGSFHIGSPRTAYNVGGAQTTSPADYCRLFAGLGYACFAINYRLGPEEPIASGLGYSEDLVERQSISLMMDRVAVIRENLGLRELDETNKEDEKRLSDIVLSAAEDLNKALDFVRENADKYNVNPDRIVLGGFSAGAVTSLNVAHGMSAPVAGVFMLSGAPIALKVSEAVATNPAPAPILFFTGQHDLSGAIVATPALVKLYKETGVDMTFSWVPAFGHFYPSGATSLGANGTQLSVEERILKFLRQVTAQ